MASFNLNYILKALPPDTITLGLGLPQNSVHRKCHAIGTFSGIQTLVTRQQVIESKRVRAEKAELTQG